MKPTHNVSKLYGKGNKSCRNGDATTIPNDKGGYYDAAPADMAEDIEENMAEEEYLARVVADTEAKML